MKNKWCLFVLIFFLAQLITPAFCEEIRSATLPVQSPSAILIHASSGQVLYERNADEKMHPASTTKIMTAILALENKSLKDTVTIDANTPFAITGSHIALEVGETLTLEQLLYAALLNSANDAALSLAVFVGGNEKKFVAMMNEKAQSLGMTNTHFNNPHGLTDEDHYTSARDLATLAKYAMENPEFQKIVSTISYTIAPTNKKTEARNLFTTDRLLFANNSAKYLITVNNERRYTYYEGATGIKNGYTSAAKNCNVASAERNGVSLIAVVLGAEGNTVWSDTHLLLDYGFSNYKSSQIAFKNEYVDQIPIQNGDRPDVAAIIPKNLYALIPASDVSKLKKELILSAGLEAPISKDTAVGEVIFYLDEREIAKSQIVTATDVKRIKNLQLNDPISFWQVVSIVLTVVILAITCKILYELYKYKKIKKNRKF